MSLRKLSIVLGTATAVAAGVSQARAAIVTGPIYVYNAAGTTLLGYVSDVYDGQNSFTYTANIANALQVQVSTPVTTPFSMYEVNAPLTYKYFGQVGGSGGYNYASGGYSYLSSTALTASGAGTSASTASDLNPLGYSGPVESTVWSVNSSNVVTAQWVNASGVVTNPTVSFYDPAVNYLGTTGNLATYNADYGDGATQVNLEVLGIYSAAVPEPASLAVLGVPAALALLRRRRRPMC